MGNAAKNLHTYIYLCAYLCTYVLDSRINKRVAAGSSLVLSYMRYWSPSIVFVLCAYKHQILQRLIRISFHG
jgi:hypothetical protein